MTTVASPHESSDPSSDARGVRRGQAPTGTRAQCQEADAACFLKETRQDAEPAVQSGQRHSSGFFLHITMLRHPKALPGWGETPPPPASQPLGTAQGPAGNRPSAARPVRASPPHRPCTQQVTPFCLSHQGPGTQQPPRSPEPQNDPVQPPPSAHWPTRLREHVPPAPACHQSLRRTPRQGPAWRPCLSFLGDCE